MKVLISFTLVSLQTQKFLGSSHLTDVDASHYFKHILIQTSRTTHLSPSRLCSCSQDLLIRFPSHFCVVLSASLELVNAFSLQQRAMRIRKGQYPCSLKFPHSSVCLFLATMETTSFLLTIQKVFFLLRCLNARSKKR